MAQKQKIYIPTYISSIDYKPARVLPHVYFWNGLRETDAFYIQSYANGNINSITASAFDTFPYFDNYNVVAGQTFPSTGSLSLLFNNEVAQYGTTPNNSLYSEYWSSYVNLLYNPRTRLIDCTAIIPLADYFKMELNDIVEWRGNYYHLRAINDYNLSNGECSLQLLGPIITDTISYIFGGTCTFGFSSQVYIPSSTTTTTTTASGPTTSTTTTTSTSTTTTTAAGTTTTTTLSPTYTIDYLIVGGGGGGGYSNSTSTRAGGGGAGAYVSGSTSISASVTFPIVIGAGGAGGILSPTAHSANGSSTTFNSITALYGGRGGDNSTISWTFGGNGGSGGGAAGASSPGVAVGPPFYGFDGRAGGSQGGLYYGGGGGSAFQTPPNIYSSAAGKLWLDGSYYAAGGAGRGCYPPSPGGAYGNGGAGW